MEIFMEMHQEKNKKVAVIPRAVNKSWRTILNS
jgi:hypothetical protein